MSPDAAHHIKRHALMFADQVLLDGGSIKAKLDENKFFAKPRLALDAVGGASAVALADALQDGCPLVMYDAQLMPDLLPQPHI